VRVGAAAGAALPTIDLARHGLVGAAVESVDAIRNGTSNYILTKMGEHGTTFAESLRDARQIGAAEADPRMDVESIDTACKLVIIATAALGGRHRLDDVEVAGITTLDPSDLPRAAARGRTIRLLGTLRRTGGAWRAGVEPTPLRSPIRSPTWRVRQGDQLLDRHHGPDHRRRRPLEPCRRGRGAPPGYREHRYGESLRIRRSPR
jgi:homoserine dehydrogenase